MARSAVVPKAVGLRATAGKRQLRFGLVNVGIGLTPVLNPTARVSANYVDPTDHTKAIQQYVNAKGEVIKPIRGYLYGEDYIVLTDSDLPASMDTGMVDLVANVDSVPSEWIESTYLAFPLDLTQEPTYKMLATYLRNTERVLIGTTVHKNTTKAFAVRWSEMYGSCIAQLLAYESRVRWDNVRIASEGIAGIPEVDTQMQQMADTLLDSLPEAFEWGEVEDTYGVALEQAILDKAAGVAPKATAPAKGQDAPDLMAALQASIDMATKAKKKGKVKA